MFQQGRLIEIIFHAIRSFVMTHMTRFHISKELQTCIYACKPIALCKKASYIFSPLFTNILSNLIHFSRGVDRNLFGGLLGLLNKILGRLG